MQVVVDGVPLKELDIKWFRKQLGVVNQVIDLLTCKDHCRTFYSGTLRVYRPSCVVNVSEYVSVEWNQGKLNSVFKSSQYDISS